MTDQGEPRGLASVTEAAAARVADDPTEPAGGRWLAAAVMAVLALGLIALLIVGPPFEAGALYLLGGALVAAYLARRLYLLLVPGCVLTGLALGLVGGLEPLGLGLGFLAIYLIDSIRRARAHWWPLLPGALLCAVGLARVSPDFQGALAVGWPILLVLAGLGLLATGLWIGRRV